MNGRLHLGHAFSLTKADFAAGYHRLKGRAVSLILINVLFPLFTIKLLLVKYCFIRTDIY